ncbi:MAG: O-antigen ligase family protein [Isosphaeraceae bacterium]
MTRRGVRSSASPRAAVASDSRQPASVMVSAGDRGGDGHGAGEASAATVGEQFRRLALGLFAALMTARAYWPSEIDPSQVSGSGLVWVLAMLIVAGLWIAASLFGGRFRFRWSWTDAAVVALVFLVGLSSTRGLDRRLAINLAWDWAGLGFAYVLARNLPRTRGESTVLAGALVVTAVAVSAYGLFQARVEIPQLQERFRHSPGQVMLEAKVALDSQRVSVFADRLLGSNEPFSTFGLANSLAGFLVGPLVLAVAMMIRNLADEKAPGSRWGAIGLAAAPLLCILTCLILTKSRSAWIGLFLAVAVLAWQERRKAPARLLLGAGLSGLVLVVALVAVGMATGRLDRQVLTQSPLSMRYRWEYWQGAWGVITEGAQGQAPGASTFWSGVGPGNFGSHYLLHKLPQSSEEIQDPHDLFLEVWAIAGFWALLALVAALALAFWNLLGPAAAGPGENEKARVRLRRRRSEVSRETSPEVSRETSPVVAAALPAGAPDPFGRLTLSAGLGLVMVLLVGQMNLFQDDLLVRWVILSGSWLLAALLGPGFWRRVPLPASAFGAAVLACVINLLAAGGIGMPAVALMLWLLIALGLNLRDDRPCGRLREFAGGMPAFALAIVWSALAGSFVGAITPFWRSEAALARADDALAHRPPDFERAQAAYEIAEEADRYSPRPWLGDAYLQLLIWESRGSKPEDLRWKKIPALLLKAASPPRNPDAWTLHSERALVTRDLLKKLGHTLSPREIIPLQASIVEATRTASRLYPTNATLHARLAEASAEISMFRDAVTEAQEALRLDAITPHLDKKLANAQRAQLKAKLPDWTEKAAQLKLELK